MTHRIRNDRQLKTVVHVPQIVRKPRSLSLAVVPNLTNVVFLDVIAKWLQLIRNNLLNIYIIVVITIKQQI